MQCKIHTPATKLQIEFNQAAILGRRDWKFIQSRNLYNLELEDPKVSVQLVDKYHSLATAISESNLRVLYGYRLVKLYHKQKVGGVDVCFHSSTKLTKGSM